MVIGSPVVLNLVPGGVMKMVHVNQADKNIDIQFQIMNGNQPYNIPEGWTGTIRGTKGDAYGYAAAVTVTAGSNVVTAHLKEQLTAVAGVGNVFELVFESTSAKVSTENFVLAVERSALNDDTVISDSDLVYANQVLNQLQSVAAVNQQVQQNKSNIATETTARQSADNTLQSNINAEASTRATADASLQSQIDQLVAPSGEAPSAAEVLNARIGADGVTYPTLGDAIRTNDAELKSHLEVTDVKLDSYLLLSKIGLVDGAKTQAGNTIPVSTTEDKFKSCDITYNALTMPHAYLNVENNTNYFLLAVAVARDATGLQIGTSSWFVANNQTDLLAGIADYLSTAKIISFTFAFSTRKTTGGIVAGINTFDYNLFATTYKIADVDNIIEDYLQSHITIKTPELETMSSASGTQWWAYANVLKAGAIYEITANANSPATIASLAVMDASTMEVLAIYTSTNTKTITPSVDSVLLFQGVKYGTGTNLESVSFTTQTLSVGTVVSWSNTLTTVGFDLTIKAKLTPDYIFNKISRSSLGVVIVDLDGNGDYTSINAAINATQDGDTILITPGIYEEKVKMWGKNRHLVGVTRESCIIVSEDRYYGNEPLQANIGSVENLTLIAGYGLSPVEGETQAGNYALHVEHQNTDPFELVVKNCKLISNVFFAVGAGVRYNQTLKIQDCYLETKQRQAYSSYTASFFNCGGLFFHNDASGSNLGTDGRIEVSNCELKGVISALAIQSQNNGNTLTARFTNNLAWSSVNGKTGAVTIRNTPTEGHIAGSDVVLDAMSFGNNVSELNA